MSRDVSPEGRVWVWQERKFFREVGWVWVGVKGLGGQYQGSSFILCAMGSHVGVGEAGLGLSEEKMTPASMGIREKEAQWSP